jgi:hypothetical protein
VFIKHLLNLVFKQLKETVFWEDAVAGLLEVGVFSFRLAAV